MRRDKFPFPLTPQSQGGNLPRDSKQANAERRDITSGWETENSSRFFYRRNAHLSYGDNDTREWLVK